MLHQHFIAISSQVHLIHLEGTVDFNYLFWIIILYYSFWKYIVFIISIVLLRHRWNLRRKLQTDFFMKGQIQKTWTWIVQIKLYMTVRYYYADCLCWRSVYSLISYTLLWWGFFGTRGIFINSEEASDVIRPASRSRLLIECEFELVRKPSRAEYFRLKIRRLRWSVGTR